MPVKRFLGLGFTFSATDKGLEKKLKGIQSALSGITQSLAQVEPIGSQAKKSIEQVSKVKKTKGTSVMSEKQWSKKYPGVQRHLSRESPEMLQGREAFRAHFSGKGQAKMMMDVIRFRKKQKKEMVQLEKVMDKLPARSKKAIDLLMEGMSSDVVKDFNEQIKTLGVTLDKTGNLTTASIQKVLNVSKTYIEGMKDIQVRYKKLISFFDAVRDWFSDVSSSAKGFLSSIGVDLSSIIPEQMKALYGIFHSAMVKPIVSGMKKVFFGLVQRRSERIAKVQLSRLDDINSRLENIAERMGGSPTDNLNAAIKTISKEMKPKKGIWDFLKTAAVALLAVISSPLILIAGILAGIISAAKSFLKAKFMVKIGKALEAFSARIFSWLASTKIGTKIAGMLIPIGEKLLKFKTWIFDLMVSLKGSKIVSKILGVFGPIAAKLLSVIKWLGTFTKTLKALEVVFKIGKFLGKWIAFPLLIFDVVYGLYQGLSEGKTLVEKICLSLWHIVDNIFMLSDLFKLAKSAWEWIFGGKKKEAAPAPQSKQSPMDDFRIGPEHFLGMKDEQEQKRIEYQNRQLEAQDETNNLLKKLLEAQDDKNIMVTAQLKGRLSGPGMNKVFFDEQTAMGTAGA